MVARATRGLLMRTAHSMVTSSPAGMAALVQARKRTATTVTARPLRRRRRAITRVVQGRSATG